MVDEPTKAEIDERALANLRRMIATPPQPKKKPTKAYPSRAAQAKTARANCLGVLVCVSRSVGQTLAFGTAQGDHRALGVIDSQIGAVRVTERKFVQITL
jgi:hypothetical protein